MGSTLITSARDADSSSTMNEHAWNLADLRKPWNGVKVMSTFACGGGSTMGYKRAGCDVIAANDIDPEMAWHYKRNHNPKHYFLCPIRDLLSADLPSELFGIDIFDGSPPCSTFSMAGSREDAWGKDKVFREGQAKQVLSDLFFDWIAMVGRLKPKVAIAENVKGMLIGNAKGYTRMVVQELDRIGYRTQVFLVNAADCGVPQRRERVFFVCARKDLNLPPLALAPKSRWVSAGDATSDLQTLTAAELADTAPAETDIRFWHATAQGRGYDDACRVIMGKASFFAHRKLAHGFPSDTLTSQPHTFTHWAECRRLTLREWKRLGSFPDDYVVKSDKIGKYMIGMSVPPKMAEQVARAVCSQWFGVSYGATE